jgi:hypothetical protein
MKYRVALPTFGACQLVAMTFLLMLSSSAFAQTAVRSPSDTVREFYKDMREKKFREAFGMSIYKPAIEGLKQQEFDDLRPDFEKMAMAVSEKFPDKVDISGEQISGDAATVFVRIMDDGKEKIESVALIKISDGWILGDRENQELVKKAGKQFFFEARINAHHSDVQDMLTKISLAEVVYNQQHNGKYGNMAELITAGFLPKDLEGTESTGYSFHVTRSEDGKTWNATAEPAQYGRTGRLSFYLDHEGVRNGDVGGKPLVANN